MKLIVTIDTEEDNWGGYDSDDFTLENIQRIGNLQRIFDQYKISPTYLITYPVATDPKSVELLKKIHGDGKCEIGAHCHPWNTPPVKETLNNHNSMLLNLPMNLQFEKINSLNQVIEKNFGFFPRCFRAGRWGFNNLTADCLAQSNIKFDTSILAFQDWRDYEGPDYSNISPREFKMVGKSSYKESHEYSITEVPASAGFSISSFRFCNKMFQLLEYRIFKTFHIKGILSIFNIVKKMWLSPETTSIADMIILTNAMIRRKYRYLNLFFHTTALKAGLSPFVKTSSDETLFLKKLEKYFLYLRKMEIQSITLSEARTDCNT